jgi:hypothetical protein
MPDTFFAVASKPGADFPAHVRFPVNVASTGARIPEVKIENVCSVSDFQVVAGLGTRLRTIYPDPHQEGRPGCPWQGKLNHPNDDQDRVADSVGPAGNQTYDSDMLHPESAKWETPYRRDKFNRNPLVRFLIGLRFSLIGPVVSSR